MMSIGTPKVITDRKESAGRTYANKKGEIKQKRKALVNVGLTQEPHIYTNVHLVWK
jgi:hypothetical protein